MILPPTALALIREYSQPITPANWRQRKWLCVGDMYKEINKYKQISHKYDIHFELYKRFLKNVQGNNSWSILSDYVCFIGLTHAAEEFEINEKVLLKILN